LAVIVSVKMTVFPGWTVAGAAATELIVKVWARTGAGNAIKANNMAKTTISTKRATYRPDRARLPPAANDTAAPRPVLKLGSDKGTVSDANVTL
jgi:hypothetical protein